MSNESLIAKVQGQAALQPADIAVSRAAALVRDVKNQITKAVPKGVDPIRFMASLLVTYRSTPDLAKCDPDSQKLAVLKAASTGLELGDEVYLIPRYNSKTSRMEAGAQIGYQGWCQLLRRSGQVRTVMARPVREGEAFEIDYAAGTVSHRPVLGGKPGPTVGYYARIELNNGAVLVEYMSREEVEEHRAKYAPRTKQGGTVLTPAWRSEYDTMACKTVLMRCKRWAPRSRDLMLADAVERHAPMQIEETADRVEMTAAPEWPDTIEMLDAPEAPAAAPEPARRRRAPAEPSPADLPDADHDARFTPPPGPVPAAREPGQEG